MVVVAMGEGKDWSTAAGKGESVVYGEMRWEVLR
jgi:hypothetical protein